MDEKEKDELRKIVEFCKERQKQTWALRRSTFRHTDGSDVEEPAESIERIDKIYGGEPDDPNKRWNDRPPRYPRRRS